MSSSVFRSRLFARCPLIISTVPPAPLTAGSPVWSGIPPIPPLWLQGQKVEICICGTSRCPPRWVLSKGWVPVWLSNMISEGTKLQRMFLFFYLWVTDLSCFAQNGAGDFIGGMKFCPMDLSKIYVASGEGRLTLQSFEGHTPTVLGTTADCSHDYHNVWWGDENRCFCNS